MPLRNKKALGVLWGLICLSLLGCNQKQITSGQTGVSKPQIVTNEETTLKKESTEEGTTKEETTDEEVIENDAKNNSSEEISLEKATSQEEPFEKEKTLEGKAEAELVVTLSTKDKKQVTNQKNSTADEKNLSKEKSIAKQEKDTKQEKDIKQKEDIKQKQTQDKGSEQHKEKQDKVEQSVSLSISCSTILAHKNSFDQEKIELLPSDGVILETEDIEFKDGDTVFDVLVKATKAHKIHMEYAGSKEYKTNYIEGIRNIYEFDCGPLSGWMYKVNGSFPNYGCSNYTLKAGDIVEWVYTCDLGKDVGGDSITQSGDAQ